MLTVPKVIVSVPMTDVKEERLLVKAGSYPPERVIETGLSISSVSTKSIACA